MRVIGGAGGVCIAILAQEFLHLPRARVPCTAVSRLAAAMRQDWQRQCGNDER